MRYVALAAGGLLLACGLLAGCSTDQYARMITEQDTSLGKRAQWMVGSSDDLVKVGRISAAERVAAPDKTPLDVWILKSAKQPARGTVLILHGLLDSKITYLNLARALKDRDFDVVLMDLRAHGRSGGKYIAFGALEKTDAKAVMDAVVDKHKLALPIYVFGADLGGAVAIQYAALDPRVQGVVALAANKDMAAVCRKFIPLVASDEDYQKALARAGDLGGFKPADASALVAIVTLRCPIILVHGQLDGIVPAADSQALYAAATATTQKELVIVPFPWGSHIGVVLRPDADNVAAIEKVVSGKVGAASQPAPAR